MTDGIRVFVDGRGIDVPAGARALDAIRVASPEAAEAVAAGGQSITDSRGLPLSPDAPLFAGTILRLVRARSRAESAPASESSPAADADERPADDDLLH